MENKQFQLFKDAYKGDAGAKDTKMCSKCKHTLPVTYFSPVGKGGYVRHECRACAYGLKKVRTGLKKLHGQPPEGYECPVCLCDEERAATGGPSNSAWVLDHDHETDDFRGWLCHRCNRALGCFHDDVPRMKRAIKYIRGQL